MIVSLSWRARGAAGHPDFHLLHKVFMRHRDGRSVATGIPAPFHKWDLNVLDEVFRSSVSIALWVFDHQAEFAAGETVPSHRQRREFPLRCARHAGKTIVAAHTVTVVAAHCPGAQVVDA